MTENDRDRKWPDQASESYSERMMFACKIVIVSGIVCAVLLQSTMLCTAKTVHIPLRSIQVFLLFLRESWQNISRNSSFSPFHSAFYPSYFCLLRRWKVPSEPLFLASRGVFLLLSLQKNNPAFLVIFAWVMWFSVDNGDWLFRG